jgi:NADPH-dependent curcumin reductase CurA
MMNKKVVLASRPQGEPTLQNFRFEESEIPEIKDGQVLLQTLFLSLDPYMRGRMNDTKSYVPPFKVGEELGGGTVAKVIASKNSKFAQGDVVAAFTGWQTHAVSSGEALQKLDASRAPLSTSLGVLGMPGLTAYTGLLTIGQPKAGETVAVAAATGPVGSAVGQIAKIKGARAIGIAGGPEKCRALKDEFGFDVALDHRSPNFAAELREACPKGIDVYFENVGGKVWEAVLPLLNNFARVPVCGLVSQYNASAPPPGPDQLPNVMFHVLSRRLTLRGFIVSDFQDQLPQFQKDMATWIQEGRMKYKEDFVDGLERAPEAFIGMLKGKNFGKLIVRL